MIIDVSHNNGIVNWQKVANAGVTDAIIRATMGVGDTDDRLHVNADGAYAHGIEPSYYHVAYSDKKSGGNPVLDAEAEAKYFCSQIMGLPTAKWLVLDTETNTILSPDDFALWLKTWLCKVEELMGIAPMVYSNKYYLDEHLPKNHILGQYPLWLANYGEIETPPLPHGWNEYFLWQYTEKGKVDGILGYTDISKTA